MNIANALRDALATLEAIRPRGVLANDASIADFYPNGDFGLNAARAALAVHDAATQASGWSANAGSVWGHTGRWIADCDSENAARIVACVNACAGIADPATFVADVRALLANSAGTFADGQGVVLTQDAEALERALGVTA